MKLCWFVLEYPTHWVDVRACACALHNPRNHAPPTTLQLQHDSDGRKVKRGDSIQHKARLIRTIDGRFCDLKVD
ncbi:hypothetical protein NQZ68_023646 [Dissostichus eleginoides]|nr:hypothetical protein NQZ68_023646 [Dissostichus eleginoides]